MDLGHAGARVIVTGGAANIGRGIAHRFAAEGAKVLVVDIDGAQAETVRRELLELGAQDADALAIDLTAEGAGTEVASRAAQRWGGIDVLVNNAGWSEPGFFTDQTDRALWQKTIEINLFSAIDCTQAALNVMREARSGSVVFISSDSSAGVVRQGIYGTTKAGLIALARTVAREHGRHGIRSNVIAPGLVVPPDDGGVGPSSVWARGKDAMFNPDQIDHVLKTQMLRRLTTPDDIGNAVVWISSEVAARQVTGQVVAVGGGSFMP
ncbi:MAG TPA: SDR family oxidoreductase [Pseudonocardia sp.]|jgi:NAD(P)-dependent dehydrogenase (short-subunit alcohol dehydrogenase family)|nr:SDR family oxidoreductase [Pseudonocardia sp.]